MTPRLVVVTGTSTDVGKTIATAALTATAGASGGPVLVVEPAPASVAEGVKRAREALASGAALAKLSQFVSVTSRYRPAA